MNTKNLFTTAAFIVLLFGIMLAFMPDFIGNQYLTDPSSINPATKMVAQGYGTTLIALAVAYWYGRNAGPSPSRQALLLVLLVSNLALMIIHPMAIMNNVETPMAWVSVLIAVVFVGWSGMLLRQESSAMLMR